MIDENLADRSRLDTAARDVANLLEVPDEVTLRFDLLGQILASRFEAAEPPEASR